MIKNALEYLKVWIQLIGGVVRALTQPIDYREPIEVEAPESELTLVADGILLRAYAYKTLLTIEIDDTAFAMDGNSDFLPAISLPPAEIERLRNFIDANYPRSTQPDKLSKTYSISSGGYSPRAPNHGEAF